MGKILSEDPHIKSSNRRSPEDFLVLATFLTRFFKDLSSINDRQDFSLK